MLSTLRTQVLVIGAGAAGINAAIAAGRNGAQTLLVEYHGFLGGISSTLPWLGFHDQDITDEQQLAFQLTGKRDGRALFVFVRMVLRQAAVTLLVN